VDAVSADVLEVTPAGTDSRAGRATGPSGPR
jgi:hypothetical protein